MKQSQQHKVSANPILRMPPNVWRQYVGPKASLFDQVGNLPEDEKLVLALHYYEGLSFGEIGYLMEFDEWDAIVLHSQALAQLQPDPEELI